MILRVSAGRNGAKTATKRLRGQSAPAMQMRLCSRRERKFDDRLLEGLTVIVKIARGWVRPSRCWWPQISVEPSARRLPF